MESEKGESTVNEVFVVCFGVSPLYVSPSGTDVPMIVVIESTVVHESVLLPRARACAAGV